MSVFEKFSNGKHSLPALIVITLLLLLLLSAQAAHGQTDLGAATGCDPSKACCAVFPATGSPCSGGQDTGTGKPINLLDGNKFREEVDMAALPGVMGLELVRYYNSADSKVIDTTKGAAIRNSNIGVLGRGWRFGYDSQVIWGNGANNGAGQGDGGDLLTLVRGDGTRLLFTRSGKDRHQFDGRGNAAGQIIWVRQGMGAGHVRGREFEWLERGSTAGGMRERFNGQGWLVERIAPTGEFLSIQRDARGWPVKVTDPQGRSLVMSYLDKAQAQANADLPEAQRQFTGLQSIDTPVGRFHYGYGSSAPVGMKGIAALELKANLVMVRIPTHFEAQTPAHKFTNRGQSSSAITKTYHYEDARWPTLLTGMSIQGTGSDGQSMRERVSTYLYDAQGRATLSTLGRPAKLVTDSKGQPIKPYRLQEGTGVEQVVVRWPSAGKAELTNALGQKTVYTLRSIAGQMRITQALGPGCQGCSPGNTAYRFNQAGQLLEQMQTTPQGQLLRGIRKVYDVLGRVERVYAVRYETNKETVSLLERTVYASSEIKDSKGRPVLSSTAPLVVIRPSRVRTDIASTAGLEHRIEMQYNAYGQVSRVTETGYSPINAQGELQATPISRTTTYRYTQVNGRSVLSEVDGPLPNGQKNSPQDSDITRYTWDARGDYMVGIQTPQGKSAITYDQAGRVASVSSEQGSTRWTYDSQQLTAVEQTSNGWPARKQSYVYDALGRMTEVAGQSKRAYDTAGRLLWQANAMGVLETNQWDALGQLTQTKRLTNAIMQEDNYVYDEQGRITQLSDNQGRETRIAYDERGRPSLIADQSGRVLDLSAAATEASKQEGTPSPVTSPQQWRDDFGRVVATRSPDHGLRTQQYDAANRLIAMRDALGNHSQYQYDARGRIVKQTIESGSESTTVQTTWRYEGDHLVELTHPTQSEQYSYDERGLRTSKTVLRESGKDSTLTAITRYAYNDQGQLTGTSLPDGSWLTYSRNGQGQVVALKRSPIHPQHLRWLAWLLPEQTIAQDFERDMVGICSYTQGNGLQTRYQRSQEGVLARVLVSKPIEALSKTEQAKAADQLLQMLGIQAAYAQNTSQQAQASNQAPSKDQAADTLATLGAMGIKPAPQALIDHRYLWDTRGNLLYTRSGAKQTEVQTYAYDGANRLVVSVASEGKAESLKEQAVNRYFYQDSKRVLQQQNAASQNDLNSHTLRVNHREGTHQWTGATQAETDYDAAGQPKRLGQRRFKWDAYGRLTQVSSEANKLTASYTYNHRGERIHKTVGNEDTAYLYDDSRQLQAELNNKKHITRQYIYLADMPLAVIDTPEGLALEEPRNGIAATMHELVQVISAVFTSQGQITYLHTNHLGAVEAATSGKGQVIWQAAYEPFGAAHVQTHGASKAFALNLRLPGQYEDAETGLFYNDHRYYDPQRGDYISPDPLGNPNGPNTYAYVAYNPLNAIDPLGLILFAFDGTGNDDNINDPAMEGSGLSNVDAFYKMYDDGRKRYVSGVGTVHEDDKYGNIVPDTFAKGTSLDYLTGSDPLYYNDMGGNYSGPARIDRMVRYFNDEADFFDNAKIMDIDIIGFSRGAAQARDFANRIVNSSVVKNGKTYYKYKDNTGKDACQEVNFRFMGLWDTVLSTNKTDHQYQLDIPSAFKAVAHAVALNEYRSGGVPGFTGAAYDAANATGVFSDWNLRNQKPFNQHMGGFPLQSIGASSSTADKVRIERGFIGAHADIGGGYPDSEDQLSAVALSWMVAQARSAGVDFNMTLLPSITSGSATLHDQSNAIRVGNPVLNPEIPRIGPDSDVEDRTVIGAPSGSTQREMSFGNAKSMTNAETHQFIDYTKRNPRNYLPLDREIPDSTRAALENFAKEQNGSLDVAQNPASLKNKTGTVNMSAYMQWLRGNGYCLAGDSCDKPTKP